MMNLVSCLFSFGRGASGTDGGSVVGFVTADYAGAAAARISANPLRQHAWSVLFALIAAEGGILLSLGPGLPISPYITTISFLIFLICWAVGTLRNQTTWSRRKQGLSS
ncbi:hypothetical protein [Mobiluncus curtisii]|uniref:hypothetical protein n=1 Tax=Mobiluncus curtisii TaxID=2051 RepID=UPI002093BAF0